jgi:hypothetical protein
MKKILSLALALTVVVALASFTQDSSKYVVSEVALSSFKKMVVDADIDVVLVQNDTLKRAFIEGDDQLVPQVTVTVKNGTLTIDTRSNHSYRGKVQVTITVQQLNELEINENAGISSVNHIKAPKLSVTVNSDCDVHLTSTGSIIFNTADGVHVNYVYRSSIDNNTQYSEG